MYEIIRSILNHTWVSGSSALGDQQYIYYIAGALIVIFAVWILDVIRGVFYTRH